MIVWDTETTGLLLPGVLGADKQPRITDIGCIQLDPRTGEVVNIFETLVNPGVPLTAEITKITGLTDHDLRDAPSFAEVLPYLAAFFLGEQAMLSHNLPFDRGMLYWELVRLDAVCAFPWPPSQFCTVQCYIEEYGKRMHLTDLYAAKLGRKLEQRHRAMSDCQALVEIVQKERLYTLE